MGKRIVVVTGASSGMGRELALQIADRYKVDAEFWLIARRSDRLYELKKRLERKGKSSRIFSLDLMNDESFSKLETLLQKERPRIMLLVNASGFGKLGGFSGLDKEELGGMIDLNCRALTLMCRICLPYMADGYGHIINFASAAAFCPQPWFSVYAATKAYVLSFSKALSEELADRCIGVTAVCPGPVRTEFFGIAEEREVLPLYKKLFMADPRRVAKKALKDTLLMKRTSTYGISMNIFKIFIRFLPEGLVFSAIRHINGK